MRILGKILKIFGVTVGVLLFLIFVGVFAILKWPELIINEGMLRRVADISSRYGVLIDWKQAQVGVDSKNLFHKTFHFNFEDFCFQLEANASQGCLDKLQLNTEIAWLRGGLRIITLGPVVVEGEGVSIVLPEAKEEKEKKPPRLALEVPDLVLPKPLRNTVFKNLKIQLDNFSLHRGQAHYQGDLALQSEITDRGRLAALQLKAKLTQGLGWQSASIQGKLTSPSHFMENDWDFQSETDLQPTGDTRVRADLKIHSPEPGRYAFQGSLRVNQGKLSSSLNLAGDLGRGELGLKLHGTVLGLGKEIDRVQLSSCRLDLRQDVNRLSRATLALNCPVVVDVGSIQLPNAELNKYVDIPARLKLQLRSEVQTAFPPNFDQALSGWFHLDMDAVAQQLLTLDGEAKLDFAGIPSQYPSGWKLNTLLDINLKMPEFQRLKQLLAGTDLAIPAPLNVLKGFMEFNIKGKADIAKGYGKVPVEFKTRLAGAKEKFDTDGKGKLKFKFGKSKDKAKLDLELLLTDLKIALPHFGITSLPALFPDGRFYDPNQVVEEKAKESIFDYKVTVKTAPENPANLISNIAQENIPVILDLLLVPERISGEVKIGKTVLEVFRRQGTVNKMIITLKDPQELSEIDGSVRVRYADYDIDILIQGTVRKPVVRFQSDPPLDDEQIISILIYGRTFDELNAGDTDTVSGVSGAVADRALTLGTLFLLASTPIQSVSYNPQTGRFSTKVRLAEGSSVTLGTTKGETQEVGYRQNIGGNWIIAPYFENDTETGEQSGGALLEWFKRY